MSRRWLSITLLFSLLLAACGQEQITAENITKKIQENWANTTSLHAIVKVDFSSPDETGSVTAELWLHKTGLKDAAGSDITASRFKILEASEAELVGTEAVFDGTQGWLYAPSEKTAYVGTKADLEAGQEREAGPTDPTAALLELQGIVQQGLDAVTIEILGEEVVSGSNAYKLKITPKPQTQDQLQLPFELLLDTTLWVDSTRWFPVKLILDANEMGSLEVVAQTLELNTAIDTTMFKATPPADAKIVNIAEQMKEDQPAPVTLDEAKAQAGFSVLAPAAGTGDAVLIDVQLVTLPAGATVIQTYAGGGQEWTLVQSKGDNQNRDFSGEQGTEVEVRGVKGTLLEGRGKVGTLLSWQENEVRFVLAGNLSSEDAITIANGLK